MKKILFLAVSFFMTLAGSAATRTIWTGSFSSGDWSAAFQPLEATLFEGVEVGNYVVFIRQKFCDFIEEFAAFGKILNS